MSTALSELSLSKKILHILQNRKPEIRILRDNGTWLGGHSILGICMKLSNDVSFVYREARIRKWLIHLKRRKLVKSAHVNGREIWTAL